MAALCWCPTATLDFISLSVNLSVAQDFWGSTLLQLSFNHSKRRYLGTLQTQISSLILPLLYKARGICYTGPSQQAFYLQDEIFHIPQCQAFCEGRFTYWDPMITTFPGLYYTALLLLSSLYPGAAAWKLLQGECPWTTFRPLCSLTALRLVNVVLSLVCLLLFRELAAEVRLRAEQLLVVDSGSQELGSGRITVPSEIELQSEELLGKPSRGADKDNLEERSSKAGGDKFSTAMRRGVKRKENGTDRAVEGSASITSGPGGPAYVPDGAGYESEGTAYVWNLRSRRQSSSEDFFKAAALALYPPHFFFAFLFYTDVGSTAAVAAMYLATLRHRFWIAALVSSFSDCLPGIGESSWMLNVAFIVRR